MTGRDPQGQPAGIVSRLVAAVLDLAVIAALLVGSAVAWAVARWVIAPGDGSFDAPSLAVVAVLYEVVGILYLAAGWAVTGRSWGQLVMGLRVVSRDGTRVGVLRSLARAATVVTFPIGLLWIAFSSRSLSVPDLLLRTRVIYDWSVGPPPEAPQ